MTSKNVSMASSRQIGSSAMPGGVPVRRRVGIVLGEATQRLLMLIDQAATDPADPLSHLRNCRV
jgi:hypothetical protein